MRIFVTGAGGFVGSAVTRELVSAGHSVLGLARSDQAARSLGATGADVLRGDVTDRDQLVAAVGQVDGVIHTAFSHDFSKYKDNCESDRKVVGWFGEALAGTEKPLIVTSGTGLVAPGTIATEEDAPVASSDVSPRVATEEAVAELWKAGINASIMRLPASVHDEGDHGFVPHLIGIARQTGVSAYIGEGVNCWPAVHRLDAARAYRLALEKGVGGRRYHAVGDEAIATRTIAEIIGKRLGLPVMSVAPENAVEHFGWISGFFGYDIKASAMLTKEWLGWQPLGIGLIEELETGTYFDN